jgi:hypothetical protein
MSLAQKIKTLEPVRYGPPCGMSVLLENLSKEDGSALQEILSGNVHTTKISNRQLHRILLDEGHTIAFSSISLHRRKQCRCFTGIRKGV